jgi:hypothetical protein
MADLNISPAGRRYGAHFSKPKASDLGFPAHLVKRVAEMPARAFLTGMVGAVKDQGSEGSCTAHGSCSLGERLYIRWKGTTPVFSPAFTYYLERKQEGTLDQGDCGAQVETSLIIPDPKAGGAGWCPLSDMPYTPGDIATAPTAAQIAAAGAFPGGAYHSLGNNIDNVKSCILSDYSCVIGISVYDSFESEGAASSGLIPYPNVNTESLLGGHETHAALGYDDAIQCPNAPHPGAVLCQNSWGTGWGCECPSGMLPTPTRGFYWMSYDFLLDPTLTSDIRMGHLGAAW